MTTAPSLHYQKRARGLTLIELTLVIVILLLFLGMTWVAVAAWKGGADRSACILNIRHMQLAVRGYSNAQSLNPGDDTSLQSPSVVLQDELVGAGKFLGQSPQCPAGGSYTLGGNEIPAIGTLYMSCSLGSEGHAPENYASW